MTIYNRFIQNLLKSGGVEETLLAGHLIDNMEIVCIWLYRNAHQDFPFGEYALPKIGVREAEKAIHSLQLVSNPVVFFVGRQDWNVNYERFKRYCDEALSLEQNDKNVSILNR